MSDELVKIRLKPKKLNRRKLEVLREETLSAVGDVGAAKIRILTNPGTVDIYIERHVERNKLRNLVDKYELIDDTGETQLLKLTLDVANQIVDRALSGTLSYNACFVFGDMSHVEDMSWVQSQEEHRYTSTGIKFWRHKEQMNAYRAPVTGGSRSTVVSTHISPEGACNLKCPYCSVTYRDTHSRIELTRIKSYVDDLCERGLKAVILTGGGEPTLYPQFNELVQWIKHEKKLSVALITNGTNTHKIEPATYACFSWIRVSINMFDGWETKIKLDTQHLNPECVVGCSMVYTSEHEAQADELSSNRVEVFESVSKVADACGASYIRLLPNCLLEQKYLIQQHRALADLITKLPDKRYFQQYKVHGAPRTGKCHQAHFRPYLSEEPWHEDGEPGTVYPCDSVVLNDSITHFAKQYQVCKPENVLDFIDEKIQMKFTPNDACKGCVFTSNVNMLDDWYHQGTNQFDDFNERLMHEEFV